MEVPADAYWGIRTQRAVENFPISDITFGQRFIRTLDMMKEAVAWANRDLDMIDEDVAAAVVKAVDEVIIGELDDRFPVNVPQTDSGTSSNMSTNEVIASHAAEVIDESIGDRVVHPGDHVSFGQSSNDVVPTAMHVAPLETVGEDLFPALETLATTLSDRGAGFDGVVKTGRIHLQDATPVRLKQKFGSCRTQVEKGIRRIENMCRRLGELAPNDTAVGTRLSMHPEFPARAAEYTIEETGVEFHEINNHFEAQVTHGAMDEVHGVLRTIADSLNKITSDLHLFAPSPRSGLGELERPENQPGSSIMPGKANPIVAGAVGQVHKQAVGNDAAVSTGAAGGQVGLNLYKPVLAHNFLESTKLLANSSEIFTKRFAAKLGTNEERCETRVEQSMTLATALNPVIGYDKTSEATKKALAKDKSIRQVVVDEGYLIEVEADEVLDPGKMTRRGILGGD